MRLKIAAIALTIAYALGGCAARHVDVVDRADVAIVHRVLQRGNVLARKRLQADAVAGEGDGMKRGDH